MPEFFKPKDAVCADFIPYYENGVYYLFYLKDYRDVARHGEGTPWFLVTTMDFSSFTEHGEVLPRGTAQEQDLYVFTGSVIKALGGYHIFYTGHNPYLRSRGLPEQAVMHAQSLDLLHWTKCPEDTFYAPVDCYEIHDWRDPFVFYNEPTKTYRMLLAARSKTGAGPRRRGMTAMCESHDLRNWEVINPLWAPACYFTHECPDLFRMGKWYYLLYSEFSQEKVTRYRMSPTLDGPWLAPIDDRLDGAAYYAAKSAGDGDRRYLFGWIPTRENELDSGSWQWGGCLCAHELYQAADGTLAVRLPEALRTHGEPSAAGKSRLHAPAGYASADFGVLPERYHLVTRFSGKAQAMGLMLNADENMDEGYQIRLEASKSRMVFDNWPRGGEVAFMPGLERPCEARERHELHILADGTAICAYLDDKTALCARMYYAHARRAGWFVQDGGGSCEWEWYRR